MLTEHFLDRVQRLIAVHVEERRKDFTRELRVFKTKANAEGWLASGAATKAIRRMFERELEIRAIQVWQSIVRVHQTNGKDITETLRGDLKAFFRDQVNNITSELSPQYYESSRGIDIIGNYSLEPALKSVFDKHDIEIDLYVDILEKKVRAGRQEAGILSQYAFYGPVGFVQTGPQASANVVQNLAPEEKEVLLNALKQLVDSISSLPGLSQEQQDELIATVGECKSEIQNEKPNNMKLKSLLGTISATIQTIASAGPAYQTLKSALLSLGISIP